MTQYQSCICGKSVSKPWATVSSIQIVECTSCGVLRVECVDTTEYTKLYTSGHYHSTGSPDLPHADAGREPHSTRFEQDLQVANVRLQKLQMFKQSGTLLDIGCANGAFMQAAETAGFTVSGVDLSADAVPVNLRNRVRVGQIQDVGLQRRSVDVITFNDALEHFIDPALAISIAGAALKRDGLLVVDVPDMACDDAKIQREKFKHVKPHEHLWYFTATQLRKFLENSGFNVLWMHNPVPGKVTAYASPSTDVTEVTIFGPPGVGDILWTLCKLKGIREREAPCKLKYVVCVDGEVKLAERAKDFILSSALIDSCEFRPIPLPRDTGNVDIVLPVYNLIANEWLEPQAKQLSDWRPELETDWDIQLTVPDAARFQARARLRSSSNAQYKYAVFYLSSRVWNQVVAQPDWTPENYADLFIKLSDNGIKPVVIGADWDSDYANDVAVEIVNKGRVPARIWINVIGKTTLSLASAYMECANITIGIANGLPMIAAYQGWNAIMLWPRKGVSSTRVLWSPEFQTSWIPPHCKDLYTAFTVGDVSVDRLFEQIVRQSDKRLNGVNLR